MKKTPRVTGGPRPRGTWREKVLPFFVKAAELNRKVVILSRSDLPEERKEGARLNQEALAELSKEADSLYDVMKPAGQIRNIAYLKALGLEDFPPGTQLPEEQHILRWLCWFRFGKPLPTLMREYQSGERKAVKQVNKLRLEFDLWKIGDVDPNRLKFKIDMDHFLLMNSGLDMGFEKLTPGELADCFDALCPCDQPHFPEHVNKLRVRILKAFPPLQEKDEI
jgi:hypothetical protein